MTRFAVSLTAIEENRPSKTCCSSSSCSDFWGHEIGNYFYEMGIKTVARNNTIALRFMNFCFYLHKNEWSWLQDNSAKDNLSQTISPFHTGWPRLYLVENYELLTLYVFRRHHLSSLKIKLIKKAQAKTNQHSNWTCNFKAKSKIYTLLICFHN